MEKGENKKGRPLKERGDKNQMGSFRGVTTPESFAILAALMLLDDLKEVVFEKEDYDGFDGDKEFIRKSKRDRRKR